jgi:hypothetical protein
MSYKCIGIWREISTLFKTFFVFWQQVTKEVTKCVQFMYIFADLVIVSKLVIPVLAVNNKQFGCK